MLCLIVNSDDEGYATRSVRTIYADVVLVVSNGLNGNVICSLL